MSVLKTALLAAVALCLVNNSQALFGPPPNPPFTLMWIPNILLCGQALTPTNVEIAATQRALVKCVILSISLQQIILAIFGGGRRAISDIRSPINDAVELAKTLDLFDVYKKMEENKLVDPLIRLRTCIAKELNLLNSDGSTFNTEALKTNILQKVNGSTIQANTKKGTDNCPAVKDFDVPRYMLCIVSYCVTGAEIHFPL